uniref:Uncharacterized protein n=1 Tax=Rhizophora mucronata TaxID=61149 RepID=A0A2P2P1Q6_RHIMU
MMHWSGLVKLESMTMLTLFRLPFQMTPFKSLQSAASLRFYG